MPEINPERLSVPDAPAIAGLIFRQFRGPGDFPAMMRVLLASEHADGNERTITLAEMTNTYTHLARCDPATDMLLAEVDGQLITYGRLETFKNDAGERIYSHFAFMDPAWRRRGIGRAMLGWLQNRLRVIAAGHPADGPRYFESFAADGAAGTEALLLRDGYVAQRFFYQMLRPDLENIPDFPLPEGLEVRLVQPEHYRAIWEADVEAFRDHWGFAEPAEADYQAWLADPIVFKPELWQIAWDVATNQVAGQVRGFINHAENEQYRRKRGWCEFISVRRPWRRRGLARALIVRTLRSFRAASMSESALGVDTENISGALRVYEDCGFRPIKRNASYRKPL